jgi:hypothetical protein
MATAVVVELRKGKRKERGVSKYSHLFESDPAFKAWYQNVLRGSHNTGSHYFLRMGRICDELCHLSPAEIGAKNKTELMTFISTVISDLEDRGISGVTISFFVRCFISASNDCQLKPIRGGTVIY